MEAVLVIYIGSMRSSHSQPHWLLVSIGFCNDICLVKNRYIMVFEKKSLISLHLTVVLNWSTSFFLELSNLIRVCYISFLNTGLGVHWLANISLAIIAYTSTLALSLSRVVHWCPLLLHWRSVVDVPMWKVVSSRLVLWLRADCRLLHCCSLFKLLLSTLTSLCCLFVWSSSVLLCFVCSDEDA